MEQQKWCEVDFMFVDASEVVSFTSCNYHGTASAWLGNAYETPR